MTSTFLTQEEVADLTDRKFKGDQIEYLRKMGIRFYISALGKPKVPRSVIDGLSTEQQLAIDSWQPGLS